MTWQDKALANVHRTASRTGSNGPGDWVGIFLRVHPDVHAALHHVCRTKGVSVTTYLRRLVVMSIVREGGPPLAEWLPKMPEPMPYGGVHIKRLGKGPQPRDDASGMEGMCTHPGCNEVHWTVT